MKYFVLLFLLIVFCLGLYYYISDHSYLEGLVIMNETDEIDKQIIHDKSINILIKTDNKYLFLNPTNRNNPIVFRDLDQYRIYKQENNYPVLYFQAENNAQGEMVYRIRPDPLQIEGMEGGTEVTNPSNIKKYELPYELPTQSVAPQYSSNKTGISETVNCSGKYIQRLDASRSNPSYNINQYPGFDPYGLHMGQFTDLDKIHESTGCASLSDNPMDTNWEEYNTVRKLRILINIREIM